MTWHLFFICVFLYYTSVSAESYEKVVAFRKCCIENQSLVRSFEVNKTESFVCLDRSTIEDNYNVSASPLLIGENVNTVYGTPVCDQMELSQVTATEFDSDQDHRCYDRLIIETINGTIKQNIPKIVALTCANFKNNTKNLMKSKLTIDRIKKCCPKGQSYDPKYHFCRLSDSENNEQALIKRLNLSSDHIYEVENELHCKAVETGIELSEEKFSLVVEGSNLIVTRKFSEKSHIAHPGEWCIDRMFPGESLIARMCSNSCSDFDAFCVKKCCPVGQHYKTLRCGSFVSRCVPNKDSVAFNISNYLDELKANYDDIPDVLGIRSDLLCSAGRVALNISADYDKHELTRDGYLRSAISDHGDYCFETFDSRQCPGGDLTVTAVTCFVKPQMKNFQVSFLLISISSVCLALTLLVYCALPELWNLHGRTLICHVSMMLLAFTCLARVQYKEVADNKLCTLLGYGIYFGFVAAFAWLNVMCLDIWWTFGSVRMVQPLRKSGAEWRRFLWYSLNAWGFASILTLVMFILDEYPIAIELDANIGSGMCWFGSLQNERSDWPHYIFFVIPMGLVTCTNFILWVLTARHCARVKSEVHRLQAGSVGDRAKRRFRIDRAKYLLTGKLWVVMGAGWISELLSTIASEPKWLWTIVDLLNELQGVFIFLILVFKPKLYYLIRKRLGLEKPDAQKNGGTSSGRTSSTFLSRTISNDERANLRVSQLNTKQA